MCLCINKHIKCFNIAKQGSFLNSNRYRERSHYVRARLHAPVFAGRRVTIDACRAMDVL